MGPLKTDKKETRPRLVFFTTFNYPSKFAHPIHGWEMARSLAQELSWDFMFVTGSVAENERSRFEGVRVVTPFGRFARAVEILHLRSVAYSVWLAQFLLRIESKGGEPIWFYMNDPVLASRCAGLIRWFGAKLLFECHGFYPKNLEEKVFTNADRFVFTTEGLRRVIVSRYSIDSGKTAVLPNAVDIERYEDVVVSKEELRVELGLPVDRFIIGYTGRFKPLGLDKGISLMIEALARLPERVAVLCVGGTDEEIKEYSALAVTKGVDSRTILVGHVASELVPRYTKACDVLAYVPSEKHVFFEVETSPMKLFEYMAAKRPIIASDMPTVREILSYDTAFIIPPGNLDAYVVSINIAAVEESPKVSEMVESAFRKVSANTWRERVRYLLELSRGYVA